MDATKHALVLTGEALPGFDANTVWPALASYFRMEPDRLRSDLLARAPITIKESEDLGKLRNLQDGASTIGAVTDLVAMGSEGNMFVLVDGTPRGPVPQAFVANRVRSGAWPSSISVAEVGSTNWRPFVVPGASPAAPDYDQQATVAFSTIRGADLSAGPTGCGSSSARRRARHAHVGCKPWSRRCRANRSDGQRSIARRRHRACRILEAIRGLHG
jgi:hypothetical protein